MIKVLHKADGILRAVSASDGVTATELSKALGLHKATLSHILKTLLTLGYLERDEAGRFTIGAGIAELAHARLRRERLSAIAEGIARELSEELGETVTIGLLHRGERYNLAKTVVDQSIKVDAHFEQRPSPFDTATGRILLAYASTAQLAEVIAEKGLPGERWPEADSLAKLDAALEGIRECGAAELGTGDGQAYTVAVPVFGPDRAVCAAIGVAVPSLRFDEARRKQILGSLRHAAERMGTELKLREEGE